MRPALVLLSILCFSATASFGQMAFKDNQNVASVGLGIGWYDNLHVPPLTFTIEHGINNDISLGGILGYAATRGYWYRDYGWDAESHLLIGFRGSYHFDAFHDKKFDTYAGLMLGYDSEWHSYDDPAADEGSYFALGIHGGGRYYFSPNVAFQLELGYNELYILNAGLCFKL